MGTRIIAKSTLQKFVAQYPDAENGLMLWYSVVSKATLSSFAAAQAVDPKVSLVNGEYLVFDIRGGRYRLITRIYFPSATLYIKEFLTHKEYDLWTKERRLEKKKHFQRKS